ncbi:MAG: PorV/PorQ family protein [candidate division WOR-3 bacterium]
MITIILSFFIVSSDINVGTTGFNFLKITPTAKEAAMANVGIGAEPTGLSGLGFLFNPATNINKKIISAGYIDYLADINVGVIGYFLPSPLSFLNSGGISITYLNSGKIKRTDIAGNELGTFSVSYLNFNINGNRAITSNLNIGSSLKILYGAIDSFFGYGLAADLGVRYRPNIKDLSFGIAIKNLGYQLKSFDVARDKLPLDIGIGVGYHLNDNINLALDIHKPIDNIFVVNLGVEGWVNQYVALRGGYNSLGKDYRGDGLANITSGFTLGLGIKYLKYQLDYSFTPMGNLGRLHHLSFNLSL